MTNATLLTSVLALTVGGVALVVAGSGRCASDGRDDAVTTPRRSPDAGLLARLDELAEENRVLRDRLAMLETRPVETREVVTDGFATKAEVDALREELLAAMQGADQPAAALKKALRADTPEFKEQVAETLAEIRKDEFVQKVKEYQDEREERLEEDLGKLGDWLDLNSAQTDEMRTALLRQYEREAHVRELWEQGVADEVLGEMKEQDGETFNEELSAFLSPEQLATFWEGISGGK